MSGADTPLWSGGFVAEQLGVSIHSHPNSSLAVVDLVGLALRRNPKRAHLLVSRVLAKHLPTEPALVIAAGELLGAFIARELSGDTSDGVTAAAVTAAVQQLAHVLQYLPGQRQAGIATLATQVAELSTVVPGAVVIGYAETATGLGRLVANALGAYYIHSTRHATPGVKPVAGFEEGHSHATSHAMVPTNPCWLDGDGPVILVDDEFSTGSTIINTIRELHSLAPHSVYVVAALIDLRSAADRDRFDSLAAELGCRIAVTALGTGWIELGDDVLGRAAALIETVGADSDPHAGPPVSGRLSVLELTEAQVTPVRSDRFGNTAAPAAEDVATIARNISELLGVNGCQGPLVVLGCEENMSLPLAVANALEPLLSGVDVRFSTTTRSPIVPLDRADYAIAGALTFASHDLTTDGPGVRFAYNLNGTGQRPGTIVVFPEPGIGSGDVLNSGTVSYGGAISYGGAVLPPLGVALAAAADDVVVVLLPADVPSTPHRDPSSASTPRKVSS